jgi:hypothetical protein
MRPEAERALARIDHIAHGGDIGGPEIVTALCRIAPVTAMCVSVEKKGWATAYAETETVRLAGRLILVLHDLRTPNVDAAARGIDV